MGKLADLLRWKKEVKLRNESGKIVETVYMRILGDRDIQDTYQQARLLSSTKREALRDTNSLEYKDIVAPIAESPKEECIDVITAARSANWNAEAISATIREDEPTIEEIAVDPDAPTLEEQEKLDKATINVDESYEKKIQDYVDTKTKELAAELESLPLEELREMAKWEISNLVPLTSFLQEVQDQKIFRATYTDKTFKTRAFDNVDEFKDAHIFIKQQLIEAYQKLEIGPDELKN